MKRHVKLTISHYILLNTVIFIYIDFTYMNLNKTISSTMKDRMAEESEHYSQYMYLSFDKTMFHQSYYSAWFKDQRDLTRKRISFHIIIYVT